MNGYSLQLAYTPEAAREVTDQIKTGLESVYHLIRSAYRGRAWEVLGYRSLSLIHI